MSVAGNVHFQMPTKCSAASVQEALAGLGVASFGRARKDRLVILDNFPADIWADGALLTRSRAGQWVWWRDARPEYQLQSPDQAKFWWDLPACRLRDQVEKAVGLWSLQPVATVSTSRKAFTLRNADEKIVVRGEWLHVEGLEPRLSIQALRGYGREYEHVCQGLSALGAMEVASLDLREMLEQQDRAPQVLALKGPYGIATDEPAEQAVRRMAVAMFSLARCFETGVIDDTDTEFVHQYRVSLRKLRSLLSLMKSALPNELPHRAKRELAGMASAMGTLRDLDVFLLDQGRYRQMLPQVFHPGFDGFIAQIRKDRQRALNATRRQLRSATYTRRCDELAQMLDAPATFEAASASRPVQRVASARILKRYLRIRAASLQVTAATDDEQVHEIRIECKKLRYMLEFFAELYPKNRLKPIYKALKRLQDVLGRFNDASVQQIFLNQYAQRSQDEPQSAALHGLIAVLHQEQLKIRAQAEDELHQFAQDHIAANFSAMFGRNGA